MPQTQECEGCGAVHCCCTVDLEWEIEREYNERFLYDGDDE